MKEQWKQGLQWGALAAVARWLAPYAVYPFWWATGESENWRLMMAIDALAAVPVFAILALTWSRYTRAALVVLVGCVAWSVEREPPGMAAEASLRVAVFIAAYAGVVQFIPALFVTPERPQLTIALALVGRWRDAARTLAGWRWVPVALAVFYLGRAADGALHSFGGMSPDGVIPMHAVWETSEVLLAIAPIVVLLGLAALPRQRATASCRT